jgi:hypothetical protein
MHAAKGTSAMIRLKHCMALLTVKYFPTETNYSKCDTIHDKYWVCTLTNTHFRNVCCCDVQNKYFINHKLLHKNKSPYVFAVCLITWLMMVNEYSFMSMNVICDS